MKEASKIDAQRLTGTNVRQRANRHRETEEQIDTEKQRYTFSAPTNKQ
jgi:hypothetical protein